MLSAIGHDVEALACSFAGVEQRENVGMLQLGRKPDLPQEALGTEHCAQLRAEDFESDITVAFPAGLASPQPGGPVLDEGEGGSGGLVVV